MAMEASKHLLVAALTCWLPLLAEADYTLKVQAHSYENDDSILASGQCCDLSATSGCTTSIFCFPGHCECDNKFVFCLRNAGHEHDGDSDDCPLGRYNTGVISANDDSLEFSAPIDDGVPNPITFTGSVWTGSFQLLVEVIDNDFFFDDLVDHIYIEETLAPSSSFTSATSYAGESGHAEIRLSFRVQCAQDFYGNDCATHCVDTDVDGVGHFTCDEATGNRICLSGWTDPDNHCLTPVCHESCHPVGGTCSTPGGCDCITGWSGDNCDVCQPFNCSPDGGYCENSPEECICKPGYAGMQCEVYVETIDSCVPYPCENGGMCTDVEDGYLCECTPGWSGERCEINIDDCATEPCDNGGTCFDLINVYFCECIEGWEGKKCDVERDECASGPCVHGECTDLFDAHKCECDEGYFGENCELEIDDCSAPGPCENGATCEDLIAGFECQCPEDYEGTVCEIYLNSCSSGPCQNGAICQNLPNNFTCTCPAGFAGYVCQNEAVECDPDSCQNGVCEDGVNGYHCTCEPGWTGADCTVTIAISGTDPQTDNSGGGSGDIIPIVGGVTAGVLVIIGLLAVIGFIMWRLHRHGKLRLGTRSVPLNIQGNAGENPAYMASDVGKARDIEVDLPNPLYTDKGREDQRPPSDKGNGSRLDATNPFYLTDKADGVSNTYSYVTIKGAPPPTTAQYEEPGYDTLSFSPPALKLMNDPWVPTAHTGSTKAATEDRAGMDPDYELMQNPIYDAATSPAVAGVLGNSHAGSSKGHTYDFLSSEGPVGYHHLHTDFRADTPHPSLATSGSSEGQDNATTGTGKGHTYTNLDDKGHTYINLDD